MRSHHWDEVLKAIDLAPNRAHAPGIDAPKEVRSFMTFPPVIELTNVEKRFRDTVAAMGLYGASV